MPDIALVVIARPVLSRSFYAQMVGRGTRIAPEKRDLLVLDFVPQNCRHAKGPRRMSAGSHRCRC